MIALRAPTPQWATASAAAAAVGGLVAGALPPLYGAGLVVAAAAVLATLANPVLGLIALTFAVPFSPPEGSSLLRLPIAPSEGLAVIVLAAVYLAALTGRIDAFNLTGAFVPAA